MNEFRIKSIVKSLSDMNSVNFFNDICTALSKAIDADFVFIATLSDHNKLATTLSVSAEGEIADNFSYTTAETPCSKVPNSKICSHPCDVQRLYPNDQLLNDMAIEGYVGIPLKNVEGEVVALLVSLYKEKINNTNEVETLFFLFSGLIEKELHKRSYLQKLELSNAVIEKSHEAILICDKQNTILYANKAFADITGYSTAEILGKTPNILSSGQHDASFYHAMWQVLKQEGHWQGEIWNKRKNGEIYLEWLSISTISSEQQKLDHYVASFSDITEQNKTKNQIKRQRYYDALTKLPNKKMLFEQIDQTFIAEQNKNNRGDGLAVKNSLYGLYVMDLDLFKSINNLYGHKFGDNLLILIAKRLKSLVRDTDIVCRTSGDNFAIFIKNLSCERAAKHVAENIAKTFSQPFHFDGVTTSCTLSIGIALFPNDAIDADDLFKKAEQAMFAAKDNGRNSFSFFDSHMEEKTAHLLNMTNDLEQAIKNDDFEVVFQPIVSIKQQSVTKFEALVRWNNKGKWISPVDFIPVAENFSLIKQIGDIVLRKSCLVLKELKEQGFTNIIFNINRSVFEFPRDESNLHSWLTTIKDCGLQPNDICFELTESVLAPENSDHITLLNKIQTAGCQIALDDFGTGYSSLSYLRRFSIDILKIDRSFIKEMTTVVDDRTLVIAIISMAKALGIAVVAEGVEVKEEVELLTELGCDYIQGFYFSKPLPATELSSFLRNFTYQ